MRIGYPCQNLSIPSKFRTCRLQTLINEGKEKIKELSLHNLEELERILHWNNENNISFFRISSDMIPFASHKQLSWVWWEDEDMIDHLNRIKQLQQSFGLRLSMHPGQYTILNSPKKQVVSNALNDLDYHSRFLSLIGGTDMILHTGGAYGNKEKAKNMFINEYHSLPDLVKKYLRLENDDKTYDTLDVLSISEQCGVPVCFDVHHERCFGSSLEKCASLFNKVKQTWRNERDKQKVHISSGRDSKSDPAHADYIYEDDFDFLMQVLQNTDVDIMVEAKAKELAVLQINERRNLDDK